MADQAEVWSELDLLDPTPDIRQLFMYFNEQYFYGKLACIEVVG